MVANAQQLRSGDFPQLKFYEHLSRGIDYYRVGQFQRAIVEWVGASRVSEVEPVKLQPEGGRISFYCDLSETTLLHFLYAVYLNDLTGVGMYQTGETSQRLLFQKGVLAYAESPRKEKRIGNFILRRRRDISEQRLEELVREAREHKKRLGAYLLEQGYLSSRELRDILALQMVETFSDSLLWNSGRIYFLQKSVREQPLLKYSPLKMAFIAAQRRFNVANFRKEIPNNKVIFRPSPYVGELRDRLTHRLNTNELFVLSLIDGFRNIDQLIRFTGADEVSIINILYKLSKMGLVRKSRESGEYEDKEFAEVSKILDLMQEMLQVLTSRLYHEIGVKREEIVDNAFERLEEHQKKIFRDVSLKDLERLDKNKILGNMATHFPTPDQRLTFIDAFHGLYVNIMRELDRFLGRKLCREMAKESRRIKSDMEKFSVESPYTERMKSVLEDIINRFG